MTTKICDKRQPNLIKLKSYKNERLKQPPTVIISKGKQEEEDITLLNQGSWRISVPRLWTIQGPGITVENRLDRLNLVAEARTKFHIFCPRIQDPKYYRELQKKINFKKTNSKLARIFYYLVIIDHIFEATRKY